MKKLNNLVPTLAKVMEDLGYELEDSISGESQDETTTREDMNAKIFLWIREHVV